MTLKEVREERERLWYGHTDTVNVTIPLHPTPRDYDRFEGLNRIAEHPDATHICLAGLRQKDFEEFIGRFGRQFEVIHFWKCPHIADLTPLEYLPDIRFITYFWNQRAERLWDMSRNPRFVGFDFDNFTRLHSLEDLASSTLRELGFGNRLWGKTTICSFEPLTRMEFLESLMFGVAKWPDEDLNPLLRIKNLKELEFPTNLFTTEQVAMLRARLKHVKSQAMAPYYSFERQNDQGSEKDIVVIGKRKPALDSKCEKDRAKLARYVAEFEALVERYENA